jgi:streptogramin lyase
MNRSGRRSHLTALLTALIACVGLLSLSTAPAWAAAGTITEFSIPPAESDPVGITAGPDGNLWFTLFFGNSIGRITTGGSSTLFPLPRTCQNRFGCHPEGITAGPDGNFWFTENRGDKIGRIITQ